MRTMTHYEIAAHVNGYELSQSWNQRAYRLKALVIRAREAGDEEWLTQLKFEWIKMRAEAEA